MTSRLWTKTMLAGACLTALMCVSTTTVGADAADEAVRIASKNITDKNPDVRAKAVADLARANNKSGATFIMTCLATEDDGPAGWNMAESISMLTSEEALDVVEKNVLKWNRPENLFGAFWTFLGLSQQNSERGNAILRQAIEDSKDDDIYLRSAAIEAMARTGRTDMAELLLKVLKTYEEDWDEKTPIIALTCIQASPKMTNGGDTTLRNNIVLALADILEKSKDDRIQWFTCKALAEITGEDTYIEARFWRWWVEMGGKKVARGDGGGDGNTVAGRDVPKFFKAAAVGKRVMFVIDISGSMQGPVTMPPPEKEPAKEDPKKEDGPVTGGKKSGKDGDDDDKEKKAEIPPPDYSKVKTKMDLAKVELIHTLKYLPDDYWFNVVIYSTGHDWIDGSNKEFVQATESNKAKFIKKVEALNWAQLTNIHGALTRGFCGNKRKSLDPNKIGKKENNPAWDPECLRTGATTIFFLTDGTPTISDDCTDGGQVGRPGGPMIGNGRFCQPENIALDMARMNVFRKCVINTVGIGPHDGRLLEALARMSGGEYIDRTGLAGR